MSAKNSGSKRGWMASPNWITDEAPDFSHRMAVIAWALMRVKWSLPKGMLAIPCKHLVQATVAMALSLCA